MSVRGNKIFRDIHLSFISILSSRRYHNELSPHIRFPFQGMAIVVWST